MCRLTETQKQVMKSFYGSTRAKAKSKMESFLAQKEQQEQIAQVVVDKLIAQKAVTPDASDMLLNDWLDIWQKEYLSYKAQHQGQLQNQGLHLCSESPQHTLPPESF